MISFDKRPVSINLKRGNGFSTRINGFKMDLLQLKPHVEQRGIPKPWSIMPRIGKNYQTLKLEKTQNFLMFDRSVVKCSENFIEHLDMLSRANARELKESIRRFKMDDVLRRKCLAR